MEESVVGQKDSGDILFQWNEECNITDIIIDNIDDKLLMVDKDKQYAVYLVEVD